MSKEFTEHMSEEFKEEIARTLGIELLQSDGKNFKKKDGTVVSPTPLPGGLLKILCREGRTSERRCSFALDTDSLDLAGRSARSLRV